MPAIDSNGSFKALRCAVIASTMLTALLAGCQPMSIRVERDTSADHEVKIRGFAEYDASCRRVEGQTITVVDAPAHGRVDIRAGDVVIGKKWVGSVDCEGTQLPGLLVVYVPEPGFRGADRLSFDVHYVRFPTVRAEVTIRVE